MRSINVNGGLANPLTANALGVLQSLANRLGNLVHMYGCAFAHTAVICLPMTNNRWLAVLPRGLVKHTHHGPHHTSAHV